MEICFKFDEIGRLTGEFLFLCSFTETANSPSLPSLSRRKFRVSLLWWPRTNLIDSRFHAKKIANSRITQLKKPISRIIEKKHFLEWNVLPFRPFFVYQHPYYMKTPGKWIKEGWENNDKDLERTDLNYAISSRSQPPTIENSRVTRKVHLTLSRKNLHRFTISRKKKRQITHHAEIMRGHSSEPR